MRGNHQVAGIHLGILDKVHVLLYGGNNLVGHLDFAVNRTDDGLVHDVLHIIADDEEV